MVITKGSRVKIQSKKVGWIEGSIVSVDKHGIGKMVNDQGDYFIKAPLGAFTESNTPIKASTLKTFKFKAIIHPKNGGDDYLIHGETRCEDETTARKEIEMNLKRKSAVIDYILIP